MYWEHLLLLEDTSIIITNQYMINRDSDDCERGVSCTVGGSWGTQREPMQEPELRTFFLYVPP